MRTSLQWTTLDWAVKSGHTNIVQLLLTYAADVNAVSDTRKTALIVVKTDGVRQILLRQGTRY